MEDWVKEFLEESPVTVRPVVNARRESRRRSLRILKRKSIDPFSEPMVENLNEDREDAQTEKKQKISEKDYGHIFVEVDSTKVSANRRRRSVANSTKKRKSQIFNSLNDFNKENQRENIFEFSGTLTEIQVNKLWSELDRFQTITDKPEATKSEDALKVKRRKSRSNRRRSRILHVPPIQTLEVAFPPPEEPQSPLQTKKNPSESIHSPLKCRTFVGTPPDSISLTSTTKSCDYTYVSEVDTGCPVESQSVCATGFTGRVLTELLAESPETCRSATPDSHIPWMQKYLCQEETPKKGNSLDMSIESNTSDDMLLSPTAIDAGQMWINAAAFDQYCTKQTPQVDRTVESPVPEISACPVPQREGSESPKDTGNQGYKVEQYAAACNTSVSSSLPVHDSDFQTRVVTSRMEDCGRTETGLNMAMDMCDSPCTTSASLETPRRDSSLTPEVTPTFKGFIGSSESSPALTSKVETHQTPNMFASHHVTQGNFVGSPLEDDHLMEEETPTLSGRFNVLPKDQMDSPGGTSRMHTEPVISNKDTIISSASAFICSTDHASSLMDSVPSPVSSLVVTSPECPKPVASTANAFESPADPMVSPAYPIESPVDSSMETSQWLSEDPLLPLTISESKTDSKPHKSRGGRKRKKPVGDAGAQESLSQDDEIYGPQRRSTRVRRKSVELFHSRQKELMAQDSDSPSGGGGDVDSPTTSEQTGPKKRKRKTKKKENIEDIYLNKLYKKPVEKMYETIYEDTNRQPGQRQRRQRRSINFDIYTVQPAKVKRRSQKATKLGWGPAVRKKNAISQDQFDLKLIALQEELGDVESP